MSNKVNGLNVIDCWEYNLLIFYVNCLLAKLNLDIQFIGLVIVFKIGYLVNIIITGFHSFRKTF